MTAATATAGLLGALGALVSDRVLRRLPGRVPLWGVGLLGAAAIYPTARRGGFGDRQELLVLAAATGVCVAGSVAPGPAARRLVAMGWLAHAGFDAAFTPHAGSRIPSWYPAMCAAYDVTAAVVMARPVHSA